MSVNTCRAACQGVFSLFFRTKTPRRGEAVPIYEYECGRCQHRFELIQKFSDSPVRKCPECAGRVERLISAPAIRFKGTGWYVTDYANKGKPDAKSEENLSKAVSSESKSSDSAADKSAA